MTTTPRIPPSARGRLSSTSIAELLVHVLDRKLSGSFVFDAPGADGELHTGSDSSALVVLGGRVTKVRTADTVEPLGRVLVDSGVIDRSTLEAGLQLARQRRDRLGDTLVGLRALDGAALGRALGEQLGRRLSWLSTLPVESAFGFYSGVDFLRDHPTCEAESLALIWRCIRDAAAPLARQEPLLSSLGARALRLHARATLGRFGFANDERALLDSLGSRPQPLESLLARGGVEPVRARRLVYAALLTHQLEVERAASAFESVPPSAAAQYAGPAVPSFSRPPPSGRRAEPTIPPPPSRSSVPASAAVPSSRPPDRVEQALQRAARAGRERERGPELDAAACAFQAAQSCISRKQFAQAERLARKACAEDATSAEYLALHAWLRMMGGELAVPAQAAQIIAALDRAVMKARDSVSIRFYRAQVLKRLGRDDDAYKDFRFVARRTPDNLDAVREVRLHLMRTRDKPKPGVLSKLFLR